MSTKLAPNAKCLVCSDEASGFHYGVYSCEGCKGFFRRCITQGINFRCSNEEKCQITPFTRNSCQYCRLKKCFQVGMSREASRLGRRPKKILRGTKSSDTDLKYNSDSRGPAGSPEMMDNPMLARATMADMFGVSPEMMQQMSDAMPMMMKNMHALGQSMPGMGMGMSMGNMDNTVGQNSQHSAFSPTSMPPGMMPPGMGAPSNNQSMTSPNDSLMPNNNSDVSATDLNKWREKQLEVMSRYMHTNKETADSSSEMIPKVEPTSKENSPGASLSLEVQTPMSSDSGIVSSSSATTLDGSINISHVSDNQKEKLHRFMEYCEMEVNGETMDIILEVQEGIITSHMQHCLHLRPQIEQARTDIKQREAAGECVKPPNGFWSHWMSELLPTIERVVRFLKDVPGFRELAIADQILSIKKGAFSIVLSQAMPMVNSDNFTILDPTLKYRNSRDDFETMPSMFRKLFDDHFLLSSEFKRACITDVETALLNAILGVNSNVQGYENETAIIKLEQIFVQALYNHILTNYPDDLERFERIIKLIPLVENTNQSHSTSLHSMKTDLPMAPANFPSLHREIYDM